VSTLSFQGVAGWDRTGSRSWPGSTRARGSREGRDSGLPAPKARGVHRPQTPQVPSAAAGAQGPCQTTMKVKPEPPLQGAVIQAGRTTSPCASEGRREGRVSFSRPTHEATRIL